MIAFSFPFESLEFIDREKTPEVVKSVGVDVPPVDLYDDWRTSPPVAVPRVPRILHGLTNKESGKTEVPGQRRWSLNLAATGWHRFALSDEINVGHEFPKFSASSDSRSVSMSASASPFKFNS